MTDLEKPQQQADDEAAQIEKQITELFRQLETAAQYNLLEKLADDFGLNFDEDDDA